VEGTRLQLQLGADGYLSGHAGCNSQFGAYTIEDGVLVVDGLGSTMVGCTPEREAQDMWYADVLTSSPSISWDGDTLTLVSESEDGVVTEIVFQDEEVATPDLPLEKTGWIVDSLMDGNMVTIASWESPATVTLDGEGTMRFFTGCNQGSAQYVVDGDQIRLSDATWTEAGCPDAPSQDLETAVLNVLSQDTLTWSIDVDQLELRGNDVGLGLRADSSPPAIP
jgi:heat shock protein HslJ